MSKDLADRVLEAVGDSPFAVALGGGADSAALLAAAVEACGAGRVRAIFVHHDLEGSDMLRESASLLADKLGVDITVLDARLDDGPDLEARARLARYKAITGNLGDAELCLTGHTSDDQAETVLMRLLRGSGATGMAGIPSVRGSFRRPFLDVARSELRQVAEAQGLPFADDPANTDDRFLRSKIRHKLIPSIEADYGASLRDNLARTAGLVSADDVLLNSVADDVRVRVCRGEVAVPVAALLTSPGAVASRVVRRALEQFHGPYRGSFDDVVSVLATAGDGAGRTLSDNVACVRENAEVVLSRKDHVGESGQEAFAPTAVVVGSTFDWMNDRYTVYTSPSSALAVTVGRRTGLRDLTANEVMAVRCVADGDRIDIDGGTTPVVELLRAAGIPARKRPLWMVVTFGGRIAALHGIRVAPWARPMVGVQAVIIEREGR